MPSNLGWPLPSGKPLPWRRVRTQTHRVEPETRYARSGDAHIAYQVVGDSPIDLVVVPGFYSNVEFWREEPSVVRFLDRLASFSRLIVFDARGCGLSDRAPELPALEQQMDDVLAVLDAVHSESAVFFGLSQGGPMAILFAATYPGRTSGLVLYGTYPVARSDDAYPWGRSPEWLEANLRTVNERWGTGQNLPFMAPSRAQDESFRRWWCRFERFTNGPGNALANTRMNTEIDVRAVLPTIRVPTLVLQRRDDIFRDPGNARYIAAHIPDAKLVELPGVD